MNQITLGAAQFALSDDMGRNMEEIRSLCGRAAAEGVRVILFPECAVTGYPGGDMDDLGGVEPDRVGQALGELAGLAREGGLFLAVGAAVPSDGLRGWTNTLVVLSDRGERVCAYSKTALTHSDQRHFDRGESLPTFDVDGVRFGCQICFDVRFPEGYRGLFSRGAHVVLHAYHQAGSDHWRQRRNIMTAFQRTRAAENGLYCAAANTIGHSGGRDQWIPTMLVDPLGEIVTALEPSETGLAVSRVDVDDLREMIEIDIRAESARRLDLDAPPARPRPADTMR